MSQGWYCQMTHELYINKIFIRVFVKLWFWAFLFIKFMTRNTVFLSFSAIRVKRSIWNQHILVINIDINNYPEETELDTNPSIVLAQTLTLSTSERSLGHFTSSRGYDNPIINFAYMNSPYNLGRDPEFRWEMDFTRKTTIVWNWRSGHKYAGNRSPTT